MFGFALAILGFFFLFFVMSREQKQETVHVVWTIQGAYALRLVLQSFLRDIPFFSHGIGGDFDNYEICGQLISVIWSQSGVHYVTQDEFPALGKTTLPSNIFGAVIYLNGGELTRLGCTAVVAIATCVTCYNLYRLAIELGAKETFAFRVLVLTLFGPALLMYTSDTYKDGFVALFVTAAVASSIRLANRFSIWHVLVGVACMFCLWLVRFYLVFLSLPPLFVGIAGLRSRSVWRPIIAALLLVAAAVAVMASTELLPTAEEQTTETFAMATSSTSLQENAAGGSGVTFDDGGKPFGAFGPKVAYTLFSPFPWQFGSIGFQIGKLDAAIWYFLAYKAVIAGRRLIRERPTLLIMFLAFLVPTIVAYSATMSNIGLIVRQRIPVVLICALLATLSQPRDEQGTEEKGDKAVEPG